jgi:hypothetical protein
LFTNLCVAKAQTYQVKGTLLQTFSYCGGANPTQEILDSYSKPKPYPKKIFYIRKGNKNNITNKIIKKFTTDCNGNFSFKLPKGTYSIIVAEQVEPINSKNYNTKFQTVNDSCLQKWWSEPYYLLSVQKKNEPLHFTIHHQCYIESDIPCITYVGPKHP